MHQIEFFEEILTHNEVTPRRFTSIVVVKEVELGFLLFLKVFTNFSRSLGIKPSQVQKHLK